MQAAPFYNDLALGPEDVRAFWLKTSDGVRIRVAHWPSAVEKNTNGTIFLFPGRSEYVEKYGLVAAKFAEQGFHTIAIDWRGQGLADRLHSDVMLGHVGKFLDYQKDVAAIVEAAQELNLPKPWGMIGHSMGGGIGLRTVIGEHPFKAAAFSGPLWGIEISTHLRPVAWTLGFLGSKLGLHGIYAPSTNNESYPLRASFEENLLTRDQELHDYMTRQLREKPEFQLGGPGLNWLYEALWETRILHKMPSPDLPCVVLLGTEEKIVDMDRIYDRVKRWPGCKLVELKGARHEVFFELRPDRERAIAALIDLFKSMT
ncbi:MAG: alpha/beta hydrolase [Pseudomonadota bacterium]